MKNFKKEIFVLAVIAILVSMFTGGLLVEAAIPSGSIPYYVSVNGNTYQAGGTVLEESVTFGKNDLSKSTSIYVSPQYDYPCYVIAVRTKVPGADYTGGIISGNVKVGYYGSAFSNFNAMLVPINPSTGTFGSVQLYVFENPYPAYRDFTISIEAYTGADHGAEIEITVVGKIK